MGGPIDSVYPDGLAVQKVDVRADDKAGHRRTMASVDAVHAADLTGQYGGIYVASIMTFFDIDTENLDEDDGETVIIDNAGNHFVKLNLGGGGSFDTSGDYTLTGNWIFNPTAGDALTIAPASGSVDKGFNITQTGPTSGSYVGQVSLNQIIAYFGAEITGPGGPGEPDGANVTAFQCSLLPGAGYDGIEAYGGSFGCVPQANTTTESDFVGLASGVLQNFTGNGRLYGGCAAATLGSGGTTPQMLGFEIDQNLLGDGTPYNIGLSVGAFGDHQAATVDAAISPWTAGGSGRKPFKNFVTFLTLGGTLNDPIDPTGDLFNVESDGEMTIANIFNMPNVTVTGDILNFPSTILQPGLLVLGDDAASNGSIGLKGPSGGNVNFTFQLGAGNPQWTTGCYGGESNEFYIFNVGTASFAMKISTADNKVSLFNDVSINGSKVLGSRNTGWTAWTGTGSKATKVVSSATTADCAAAIKSIIDALIAHGLIGT